MYRTVVYLFGLFVIRDGVRSIESPVRERDLSPRNFNHHPYATLVLSKFEHPYAALSLKLARRKEAANERDVNRVFRYGNFDDYVRRVLGESLVGRGRSNPQGVKKFPPASPKSEHTGEYRVSSTRGRYTVALPDGRLQIVDYVADDDGYRADVSYERQKKVVAENVRDSLHGGEKDLYTTVGTALRSANLAEVQEDVRNAQKHADNGVESRNRIYQRTSPATEPTSFPAAFDGILLPAVTPTYTPASTYDSSNGELTSYDPRLLQEDPSLQARSILRGIPAEDSAGPRTASGDCDYLNYGEGRANYRYPCSSRGLVFVRKVPKLSSLFLAADAVAPRYLLNSYRDDGSPVIVAGKR